MSIPKSTPDRRVTRVMGVDPGLTRCGVGVVEGGLGSPLKLIAVGVIRTPADLDHAHRLLRIHDGLEEWRDHTRPDAVAVEKVFAQHNRNTVTGTAQAAGMAMMIAAERSGVTISLHVLEGAGMIRSTRGRVRILDRHKLQELAGDGYGQPEAEYRKLIGPFGKDGPSLAPPA